MLLPASALAEYESRIDHKAFILDDSEQAIEQGREIYQQICHNCHGDINLPGSIPNALLFDEGQFQHGNDPYTMYRPNHHSRLAPDGSASPVGSQQLGTNHHKIN